MTASAAVLGIVAARAGSGQRLRDSGPNGDCSHRGIDNIDIFDVVRGADGV